MGSVDGGGCRGAHLDSAGAAQILHGADPGVGNMILFALLRQGSRDGGVGVFRQEDLPGPAGIQSFSELLDSDHEGSGGQFRQIPAFRDFKIILCIHTKQYYTHFFGKVNKFSGKIFTFPPFCFGSEETIDTQKTHVILSERQRVEGSVSPENRTEGNGSFDSAAFGRSAQDDTIVFYLPAMDSFSTSTLGAPKAVMPRALGSSTFSATAVIFFSRS